MPAGAGVRRSAAAAGQQLGAVGYAAGWWGVRHLPEPAARRLFDRIADSVHRRDGRGVQRLRANLERVAPGRDLTRAAVRSYMRYWCEAFRLPAWPLDDLVARTRVVGEHHLRDAYAAGRGVVVPLPHTANWDWAGAWAVATGMPLMTVAERLEPARLFDEFVAYREGLGMRILPLGDDRTFDRLTSWVGDGGLACLLADRDLSRNGVAVELCGRPARMPRGPALLARRTGAPLVPATLHYDGPDLVVTVHPPVPHAGSSEGAGATARMTQDVADAFTEGIRAHPQDWHMMQQVFTEDLV